MRRLVDQPLQQIDVLGPAGAAVGVRRRRVGVGGAHADVQRRRPVGADQRACASHGRDGGPVVRGIGAEICDALDGQREELAVRVQRERRPRAQVPALVIARHGLAPLRHPLDRASEPARREQHQRVLGIDPELDPEGTAHVGRHHAHPLRRHLQHVLGQNVPHQVDALRAGGQRVDAAARVVIAERRAGLHGADADPLVAALQAHPMGCDRQRRLRRRPVAQLPVDAKIAGRGGVKRGRVLTQRRLGIRDRGKLRVVDRDRLGRSLSRGRALPHHEGDRVAHHAHAPRREHRARRRDGRAAVGALGRHHAGNRADPGVGQIGSGVDRQHPRHHCEVVEIAPASGEDALVLHSPLRGADTVRHPAPAASETNIPGDGVSGNFYLPTRVIHAMIVRSSPRGGALNQHRSVSRVNTEASANTNGIDRLVVLLSRHACLRLTARIALRDPRQVS